MTLPDARQLLEVVDGTWPAAAYHEHGPWLLREGRGGGQRVSAATLQGKVAQADLPAAIAEAETQMRALGQEPLFMIRAEDAPLDEALEDQGYRIKDPVNIYVAPIGPLAAERPPRVTALLAWEPLAIMRDIWAEGGIGAGRIDVMMRARGPKTGLIGRLNDHPAAAGFCAIHKSIAMVHALEVLPHQRRQKMGRYALREFAHWAKMQGASHLSLVVTRANTGANALYTSLGMRHVGEYHYRIKDGA